VLVGFVVALALCALLGVIGALLVVLLAIGFSVVSIAGNAIAYMTVLAPYVGRFPALALAALVAGLVGYLLAVGGTAALAGRVVAFAFGSAGVGGMAIVYRQ
jgi:hypothetical protein